MKIILNDNNITVKVKARKFPAEQRKFLIFYFDKLVEIPFLKPCTQASRHAAPHLLPKYSRSKCRTMIDLPPVNATKKAKQWAMPVIGIDLSDSIYITLFASLKFFLGYIPIKSNIIQCVWDHCTARDCYIHLCVTWVEERIHIVLVNNFSLIWHREACVQSMDRRFLHP